MQLDATGFSKTSQLGNYMYPLTNVAMEHCPSFFFFLIVDLALKTCGCSKTLCQFGGYLVVCLEASNFFVGYWLGVFSHLTRGDHFISSQ